MRRILLPFLVLVLLPVAAAGTPELSIDIQGGQACPTGSAEYAIDVHNPGPAADRYTLNVDAPWENAVTLSQSPIRVNAGETETVYMWMQVPKRASPGEYSFTVSTSSSNNGRTTSQTGTVRVPSCRSVSVTPVQEAPAVCRGDDASYTFRVENDGEVEETYTLSSDFGALTPTRITLGPGDSEQVQLTASSMEAVNRSIQVRAESTSSYAASTASVNFVTNACRSVDLSIAPESTSLCRSDNLTLTSSVENTGSIDDQYTLTVGGQEQNVSVGAGDTVTVDRVIPASSLTGNVQVTVASNSLPGVSDSAVSDVTIDQCYGLSLVPVTTAPEAGNRTLVQISLSNNGTRANTYTIQLDGPDWIDVQPTSTSLESGGETPVYVYLAPDFFGDGAYTASLIASGQGAERTMQMNVTAVNGTVTVDIPRTRTPTGRLTALGSGAVAVIVTALILFIGGYYLFYRQREVEIEGEV